MSEFKWARKSMRIWPILWNNKEELRKNLDDFLRGALLMPRHEVNFLAVQEIKRAKPTSCTQVHDEIIVTFSKARDRDEIYRKAGNLAPTGTNTASQLLASDRRCPHFSSPPTNS